MRRIFHRKKKNFRMKITGGPAALMKERKRPFEQKLL